MDDPKKLPDGSKETPRDASKGTPQGKGKLYTDAEISQIKADSAAMGQGREKKVATEEKEALTQELQATQARLDALERDQNQSRLAEARGDPTALRIHQREQAIATRERAAEGKDRDLTRREAQLKAGADALATDKGVVAIAYIAAKHGLATELLESFGITDPEALEKVAAGLAAAAKPKDGAEDGEEGGEVEAELEIDSGLNVGGLTGIKALAKANEDFAAGKITEEQFKVIASKHSND